MLLLMLDMTACQSDMKNYRNKTGGGTQDQKPDHPQGGSTEEPGLSLKSELRFKKQKLIENDLAQALSLNKDELCNEFGKFNCINAVHHLSLGGVDAYEHSVLNGIQESMTTTPIIIERIALSACSKRAKTDLSSPGSAVIFKGMQLDVNGRLSNPSSDEVANAIDVLAKRVLRRKPTADDINAILDLYTKIEEQSPSNAAEKWATLACYSLVTSVESVLY